jgi:methionyl-tRNA synthetase
MARFLVTSALPYINGVKHLGNLAGSMLPADVHARFLRMRAHDVLFICGTDEHGTPAELAAAEAHMEVRDYCDLQHESQKEVCGRFLLSFDWFGRSSSAANRRLTQHFCDCLEQHGLIEERVTQQIYSIEDNRFLPDRYVEGTCPFCGFDRARGDQCDGCGRLLDPAQLRSPRSKISGSTKLHLRDTAHLFLRQSLLADRIESWIDGASQWPHLARSIAHKWLDEGLQDRAITRDLSWGVPVTKNGRPRAGFEHKVFYVWFDAPIEYIGATQEWAEATGNDWQRWWRTDKGADDVTYIQFMGKDNVAFHAVSFPATLIGSGEPWKLVDRLKAFNWVTWYGGKFSTSENMGIFMDQALELLPADCWRWFLMANAPEAGDSAFTWEKFRNGVNSDLADVLGNFINRVTHFCHTRLGGRVPVGGPFGALEHELLEDVAARLQSLTEFHEQMEFRKACAETRALWTRGNQYVTAAAPWRTLDNDRTAAETSIRVALELSALFADVAEPFVPGIAHKIRACLGRGADTPRWPDTFAAGQTLQPGVIVTPPKLLVRRIEQADIARWAVRFDGGKKK